MQFRWRMNFPGKMRAPAGDRAGRADDRADVAFTEGHAQLEQASGQSSASHSELHVNQPDATMFTNTIYGAAAIVAQIVRRAISSLSHHRMRRRFPLISDNAVRESGLERLQDGRHCP